MAYKKYIKRNGKIYGPYIYHSKRVDGKVVTEYKGSKKIDFDKARKVLPFLGIVLVAIVLFFAIYVLFNPNSDKTGLTGFSVLDLNAKYNPGENLRGSLDLVVGEGELIPASSRIVFTSENKSYEYSLQDLLTKEELVQGNFYVQGTNLSGEGIGYGLRGQKNIFPDISFVLLASKPSGNDTFIETEINGNVSKEDTFEYSLGANESVEIKPLSVEVNGTKISESVLFLNIENNTAFVTTNYSSVEEGFGKEYFGENNLNIPIDLSPLNLSFNQGPLGIRLDYLGNDLSALSVDLGAKNASVQIDKVIPKNNGSTEIIIVEEKSLELNKEEKLALENAFGNVTLSVEKAFSKNGFITVKYTLGEYWVEYSYSEDLDNETLNKFMEQDRVKWLKDLALKISSSSEEGVSLEGFKENYSF